MLKYFYQGLNNFTFQKKNNFTKQETFLQRSEYVAETVLPTTKQLYIIIKHFYKFGSYLCNCVSWCFTKFCDPSESVTTGGERERFSACTS